MWHYKDIERLYSKKSRLAKYYKLTLSLYIKLCMSISSMVFKGGQLCPILRPEEIWGVDAESLDPLDLRPGQWDQSCCFLRQVLWCQERVGWQEEQRSHGGQADWQWEVQQNHVHFQALLSWVGLAFYQVSKQPRGPYFKIYLKSWHCNERDLLLRHPKTCMWV